MSAFAPLLSWNVRPPFSISDTQEISAPLAKAGVGTGFTSGSGSTGVTGSGLEQLQAVARRVATARMSRVVFIVQQS